jgi:hypothetical protein
MKKRIDASRTNRKTKQQFPRGWDEKRIKDVIDYYDRQTEEEELAEYEAAMKLDGQSVMLVPTKLVPESQRLIARRS